MNSGETPVLVASGLGWPEGPTVRPDGSVVFVESYRSQLTVAEAGGETRQFAYTAGAPNACVLGGDGALYVCQNGGTVGPWRATEMTSPSIQRVYQGSTAETLVTEIAGIPLNGPNDLVFHADGRLIFTDPGTYNPDDPDPSYIFAITPDGSTSILVDFPAPVFPNGVAVEDDGSIVWDESYTGHVGRLRPDGTTEDLLEVMTFQRADGHEVSLKELPLSQVLRANSETVRAEEMVLSHPGGRSITTLVNSTPMYSEDGELESVISIVQDISPMAELERLLCHPAQVISSPSRIWNDS